MAEEHIKLEINDYNDSKIGVQNNGSLSSMPVNNNITHSTKAQLMANAAHANAAHANAPQAKAQYAKAPALKLPTVITSGINPKPDEHPKPNISNNKDSVPSKPVQSISASANEPPTPTINNLPNILSSPTTPLPKRQNVPIKNISYEGKKFGGFIVGLKTPRRRPLMQMGGGINRQVM